MRLPTALLLCLPLALAAPAAAQPPPATPAATKAKAPAPKDKAPRKAAGERWGLVVHGGAGNIAPENLTPERQAAHKAVLEQALRAGHAVLARGGSSLDAVQAAVVVLEDSPLFNAGRGAVFTNAGRNELDAAVMDGATLRAGSVAGLTRVKNPVLAARAVMDKSEHVMLIGAGAEAFAQAQGLTLVDPAYFFVEERWAALQRARAKAGEPELPRPAGVPSAPKGEVLQDDPRSYKFGTVGAVALDKAGRLAAATSTGGMTNKRWGRVGDVPVIGAGTYAAPHCAVSATGHGEFFIRHTVGHDVCARALYGKVPVRDAADAVVMDVLVKAKGEGGLIAMDAEGNVSMPFNSTTMYRGVIDAAGNVLTAVGR